MPTTKKPTPAEAALDWIRRALSDELPDDELETVPERADALHAICVGYGIRVEHLITWIHDAPSPDRLTAVAWKRECQRHIEAQLHAAMGREAALPKAWE